MCLERSQPVPLEVTVEIRNRVLVVHRSCRCEKDKRSRLVANEAIPCERHFVFEPLAEERHWKRIRALNLLFEHGMYTTIGVPLSLGSCRFFNIPSLQHTSLKWTGGNSWHAGHLFSAQPFVPTLRSLSFRGADWNDQIAKLNNLTSLAIEGIPGKIDAESFRTFILNNTSLETLLLGDIGFEGDPDGPPVILSNLKSFRLNAPLVRCEETLSTFFHVPALQRLSSLSVSARDRDWSMLHATGDDITFTLECDPEFVAEEWQNLTEYARPTIRLVRLQDSDNLELDKSQRGGLITLFTDAHTLEIGDGYTFLYPGFLDDLKQLGPQLKTIRFEIPTETEPFLESGDEYDTWGGTLLNDIEELVTYRFEQGRPFSTVERMVVSESEWVNRQQEFAWRCFYNDRHLNLYLGHE